LITQSRVIVVTDPQTHSHTNPQTGPITIHYTDKLSMQCNDVTCTMTLTTSAWHVTIKN